jgi:hypothetical protein
LKNNKTYHFPCYCLVKVVSILVLLMFCSPDLITAQTNTQSEYKVKAIFLYNFTRFIDWPNNAFASNEEPFKIGIVGTDPFGVYLEETVRGEKVSGRSIVVERYKNMKEIKNCHMLYINVTNQRDIKNIVTSVGEKKTLTISENPEFVKWGGMIRIYSDDNKIRIQINDAAARKAGIKISAKLLNVAEVYYP